MSNTIKELYFKSEDNVKRVIYLAKEFLKDNEKINVISNHYGALNITKGCNALLGMNYISIDNVQTLTVIRNERRKLNLVITISKTKDFDKLYAENLEKRNQLREENEKTKKEVTKDN